MFASIAEEPTDEPDHSAIMHTLQGDAISTLKEATTATGVHATTGEAVIISATPPPENISGAVPIDVLFKEHATSATDMQTNSVTPDAVASTMATPSVDNLEQQSAMHKPALDTRKQVAEDMRIWKEKFAVALGRGAKDLEVRIESITARQITTQADDLGRILTLQLEDTTQTNLNLLKDSINSVVRSLSADASSEDEHVAQDSLHVAIRSAGRAIKDKAQSLRDWKTNYDEDTLALVKSATESTLDVIDGIRDLGLQEIGLRWTSMADIIYDDWAEYHGLKKAFDADRIKVVDSAAKHIGLARARQAGEQVEEAGMQIAEQAAKELVRLKDVALWKIRARDSTDDFESRPVGQAMAFLSEKIKAMVNPSHGNDDVDEATEDLNMPLDNQGKAISEDAIMSTTMERCQDLQEAVSSWQEDDVHSASMTTTGLEFMYNETSHSTTVSDFGPTPPPDETNTSEHTNAEASIPTAGYHNGDIDINEDHTSELPTDEVDPSSPPAPQAIPDETADDNPLDYAIEPDAPLHSIAPTLGPSAMITGLAVVSTDTVYGHISAEYSSSRDMQEAASEAGEDYAALTRSWMAATASTVSAEQVVED